MKRKRIRGTISDGLGNTWARCEAGARCGLQVVRPGKVQCSDESACPRAIASDEYEEKPDAEASRPHAVGDVWERHERALVTLVDDGLLLFAGLSVASVEQMERAGWRRVPREGTR